jgi:hypothetical protein
MGLLCIEGRRAAFHKGMERAWLMTFCLRTRAEIAHRSESGARGAEAEKMAAGAPLASVNLIRVNL